MQIQINPYLNFNGNCDEAFGLYAQLLGGKIEAKHTFGDSPMGADMGPEWKNKIMHGRLTFEGGTIMASDLVDLSASA